MERDQKLVKQYEILQMRLNLHGTRMWQLPFTYLTLIGVILSFTIGEEATERMSWIFMGLMVLGVFLVWALSGAYEGYSRTVKDMNGVERELEIGEFTKCKKSHYLPYFILMILGIGGSLTAFLLL